MQGVGYHLYIPQTAIEFDITFVIKENTSMKGTNYTPYGVIRNGILISLWPRDMPVQITPHEI